MFLRANGGQFQHRHWTPKSKTKLLVYPDTEDTKVFYYFFWFQGAILCQGRAITWYTKKSLQVVYKLTNLIDFIAHSSIFFLFFSYFWYPRYFFCSKIPLLWPNCSTKNSKQSYSCCSCTSSSSPTSSIIAVYIPSTTNYLSNKWFQLGSASLWPCSSLSYFE
jgi:hypothetical protein